MDERRISFHIPGSVGRLLYERTEEGQLLQISGGGRVYYEAKENGRVVFDGGFVTTEQTELPTGMLRTVQASGLRWTESYAWDQKGLLTEVDGVSVRYDDQQRVMSCADASGTWYYGYSGSHLTVIDTPYGLRQIVRGEDGRPLAVRDDTGTAEIVYDADGKRVWKTQKSLNHHFDSAGRLWTVCGPGDRVLRIFLWDRYQCLCCIDGDVGAPLKAVYSLDPTGTPVRIINHRGMRRIPRDAFGEALLRERQGVGLFSGALIDGSVHLPFRRLDPFTGSFDRPDPMHGEQTDPRRAAGYSGPLAVELPSSGPYTVCRNNPVTLADPTGAISDYWWFIPSSLTWSLQNTIGSLLGMWLNLEFSPLGMIVDACAGANPFDIEWISAKNYDSFAMRSDGWLARLNPNPGFGGTTRTWTYQFLVNAPEINFTNLEHARLFAPDSAFRPRLYGTVLRCTPKDNSPFLLRGQRTPPNSATLLDWSRQGGSAEPVIPGSLIPVFPSGGLHLGKVQRGVKGQSAEVVELEPSGSVLSGTVSQRAQIDFKATGLGLSTNSLVVLVDPANAVEVARVLAADEANGHTLIRVDTSGTGRLAASEIRLEGLSALVGTENLSPVPGHSQRLSLVGSSNDYRSNVTVLRLNRAGAPVGFAKVSGLEAQLGLDAALPSSMGNSLRVRPAVALGNFSGTLTADPNVLHIVTGTVPIPGTGIVVGTRGSAIATIVQTVNAQDVTVDRSLAALGGNGTAAAWQSLSPLPAIGVRSGDAETQAQITYVPDRAGTAPASGFLWVEGAGIATRRVTGLNYEAVVLGQPLPDSSPNPYSVDRFTIQAPDVSGGSRSSTQLLALNMAPPTSAKAFHAIELSGSALAAGTAIVNNAALAGDTATVAINPASPPSNLLPGQIVVLQSGANLEAAAVKQLRLTVTLSRALPLSATGLEAVLLSPGGPSFAGVRRNDRVARVQPSAGKKATDMPRFAVGELVQVTWTVPSAGERLYRVQLVNGTTITGADDEDIIPNTVTNVTVRRLVVQDPKTGSSRLGIDGQAVAGNRVQFSAWAPKAFNLVGSNRLGIVDGQNVYAVNLAGGNQDLGIVFLAAPGIAGPLNLSAPPQAGGQSSGFSTRFTMDGASLAFLDTPISSPLTGLILTVPYIETIRRVGGNLGSGTVRVPDDHENAAIELNRRQALEDHELTHTHQAARLGPWLFAYFPLWVFEMITDLATPAGMPEYGPYTPATVDANLASVTIPPTQGITIEADSHVQVAQSGRAADVRLGSKNGNTYTLTPENAKKLSAKGIQAGPAQVRREESGLVELGEWFVNIAQFFTVGGLMNQITVAGWEGVIWLITMFIQWIRSKVRNTVNAQIAADQTTLTLATDGKLEGVAAKGVLAIQQGDKTFVRPVKAVQDRSIVLETPVPLQGDARISAYSTSSALFPHWHDYYPATFPDANRPASLKVEPVNGKSLTLAVDDRVHIRSSGGHTFNTVVTSVGAGGLIEVEEESLVAPGKTDEFFIAKIGEDDPMGVTDQFLLNQLHLGWMQYIHDPWGQIIYRAKPTSTVGKIFARSARYLFGTQGWSVLPALGYFWWDNAFPQINETAQRSHMEQEASHRSGDTYCPIGTLGGDFSVVGDVARYWLTEDGAQRDNDLPNHMINLAVQDTPGANPHALQDAPGSSMKQCVSAIPTTGDLPAGVFVPDAFFTVNSGLGIDGVSGRGWIPTNNVLERSCGAYVAFTRPGSHTVTAQSIDGLEKSRDAQSNGFPNIISHQRTVQDVAVTLATLPVAEGAVMDLIPYQRAALTVTPDGSRVYRATLTEPGAIATIDNSLELVINGIAPAAAPAGLATENIEISRFYRYNAGSNAYDSGLGPVNLPSDIDIGVRRFQIRLVDTLPLLATADPAASPVASVKPGDARVILIPAPFVFSSIATSVTGTPSLTPQNTPINPIPAAAQGFVRDGGAINVLFPADQPPEAQASLSFTIPVAPPGSPTVPVTCQVTVAPHFTLDSATGFNLTAVTPLTLRASDNTNIMLVGVLQGIVATSNNAEITLTATPTTTSGPQTVLVTDIADANRMARRTIIVVT